MRRSFCIFAALALFFACTPQPSPKTIELPQVDTTVVQPTDTTVVEPVDTTEVEPVVDPVVPQAPAPMLDFIFDEDGSARDGSANSYWIDSYPGVNMMTYYNEAAERYVARFFNSPGVSVSDGFYKFAYNSNTVFKNALANGHSFEVLFMLGEDIGSAGEVKMFSSMEQGGTGFLITDSSRGRVITFLPNTTDASGKAWRWCTSGITPEVGRYYHVVGVWDCAAGKARIYVDGKLRNTVAAAGSLNFPNGATSTWLAVGGDPSGTACQSSWNGDVVIARVYDEALTDEEAALLWEAAPKLEAAFSFSVSNVIFLPECEVSIGGQYTIAGDGFQTGDIIRLVGPQTFDFEPEVLSDRVVLTIPTGFVSGSYKIFVVRGSEALPIGSTTLTVVDTPAELHAPKIVAHRGFHGSGRPENSIASLKAAQDGGYYGSEMDLWITADGVVYVNHDGTISGKVIQNCTSADLASVTLSNGEPLPTFRQYLDQAILNTDTRLVIEIKQHTYDSRTRACTEAMLELVDEYGLTGKVDYISFSRLACDIIAQARPGATVGYLTSYTDLEDLLSTDINCIDYAYNYLFANPDLFEKAHALGMEVNIWTVDSTSDMMKAIALGADYITTNKPDVLQGIVDRFF